jgi:hypothetical protein
MVLLEIPADTPYGVLIHHSPRAAESSHPRKWWSRDARDGMNFRPLAHAEYRAAHPAISHAYGK